MTMFMASFRIDAEYSLTNEEKLSHLNTVLDSAKGMGIEVIRGVPAAWYWDEITIMCSSDQLVRLQAAHKIVLSDIKEVFAGSKVFENAVKTPEGHCENNFNQRIEVHMPGHALAMYNEVMLLEDSCTDALQSNLNKGWRIIAACPQPDSRRPDYILGRYNPNSEILEYASRG